MNDGKIKSFTDLNTWEEAHKLCLYICSLTRNFPNKEKHVLISQMRRAAISMTSNIAEGFSRKSYANKGIFYSMAPVSNTELQNQILITRGLGYLAVPDYNALLKQCIIVNKLLNGLIKKSKIIHNS